jgi:hypothetical protein
VSRHSPCCQNVLATSWVCFVDPHQHSRLAAYYPYFWSSRLQTYLNMENEQLYGCGAQWPRGQCASACDRGSQAMLVYHEMMSDQKNTIGRHVKPLVLATFAVVSTHQPAQDPHGGLWPFFLCVIHKEGLSPSSGDINRLMMMMMIQLYPNLEN